MEKKDEYIAALEQASARQDISQFTTFITFLVNEGLRRKSVAELPGEKRGY